MTSRGRQVFAGCHCPNYCTDLVLRILAVWGKRGQKTGGQEGLGIQQWAPLRLRKRARTFPRTTIQAINSLGFPSTGGSAIPGLGGPVAQRFYKSWCEQEPAFDDNPFPMDSLESGFDNLNWSQSLGEDSDPSPLRNSTTLEASQRVKSR